MTGARKSRGGGGSGRSVDTEIAGTHHVGGPPRFAKRTIIQVKELTDGGEYMVAKADEEEMRVVVIHPCIHFSGEPAKGCPDRRPGNSWLPAG